ncbi:MAG: MFS transporter [Acidimicrobiales bacterium]
MTQTTQAGTDTGAGRIGFRRGRRDQGAEAFTVSPFNRLARTHGLSVAGDTLLAIALADSLFFAVDPNDARWKVGAYLLLTIAPFAIVAPFLGPVMDRVSGGHRYMIIGTAVARAMLMAALVLYVQEWPLFPLAFAMLVMGKTYAVAKSAVVPTTVATEDELVRSNSRLSILSAVSGAAVGVPGVLLLRFGGAPWVLAFGVVIFLTAALMGLRIPSTKVAADPVAQEERTELKGARILVASSAMGYLRGAVGFITMLLAFDLRGGIDKGPVGPGVEIGHRVRESIGLERLDLSSGGAPPWHFGVALIGVGIGGLIGSASVPKLRSVLKEERILAYALIGLTGFALLAAISTGLAGVFIMSMAIALAAQGGKQAFDAIVQRDAPRANLGRTFSRYESRFQLVWVLGALLPVVIPFPVARAGYLLVAGSAAFVALTYWFGRTPNPAAIISDGILDDGLDWLAAHLPGSLGRRLAARTWARRATPGDVALDGTAEMPSETPEGDKPATEPEPDRTAEMTTALEATGPRPQRRRETGTQTRSSSWPESTEPGGESLDPTVDLTRPMPRSGDETEIFPGSPAPPRSAGPVRPQRRRPLDGDRAPAVDDGTPVRQPPAEPDSWPTRQP